MRQLVVGLDFGSDSARAVLVDSADGSILATSSMDYPRWKQGLYCDAGASRFRQHPQDYADVLRFIVPSVVEGVPEDGKVVAIGVDTTASTPCLLDSEMNFIADDDPDAMFVLWKDHTAIAESEELSRAFAGYLSHCGGIYSAENFWSKVLHILRTNPAVASKAAYAIEQSDYIPYLLGGRWKKGRCAAASKYLWDADSAFPPLDIFNAIDPVMGRIAANMTPDTYCSQETCSHLCAEWAKIFGLDTDVVVSVGNVDAHSGAVGAGCSEDTMVMNLGTSACIMAVGPHQQPVTGVFGQAADIIVPGLDGYEMGLSSFGDNYKWLSAFCSRSISDLSDEAAKLAARDDLPLCTDWLNGRRTPAPAPNASATFTSVRMSTTPAELFWGIVEATCFGVRAIVEHLSSHGVTSSRIVAVGGISRKSPFVMQMLADVLGRDIQVSSASESCALGAAMNASVAAGIHTDLMAAQKAMAQAILLTYHPSASSSHDDRYSKYLKMY